MQGWRNVTGWGAVARCMVTLLPNRTLKLDESAESLITLKDNVLLCNSKIFFDVFICAKPYLKQQQCD